MAKKELVKVNKKTHIVVHHTAGGSRQTAEEIKAYLRNRQDLGGRLAYAKIIERDGSVHNDAPELSPFVAHAPGYNKIGIGVCLIGWFDSPEVIQSYGSTYKGDDIHVFHPQFKALVQTCAVLCKRHGISPDNIIGHRDNGQKKTCPGEKLYALLPELKRRVRHYVD